MQDIQGRLKDYDVLISSSKSINELCMKMQLAGEPLRIQDTAGFLAKRAMAYTLLTSEIQKKSLELICSWKRDSEIEAGVATKDVFSFVMSRALEIIGDYRKLISGNLSFYKGEDIVDPRLEAFSTITALVWHLSPNMIMNLRDVEGNNPLMVVVRSTSMDLLAELVAGSGYIGNLDFVVENNVSIKTVLESLLFVGCDPMWRNNRGIAFGNFFTPNCIEGMIQSGKRTLLDRLRRFGTIPAEENQTEKEEQENGN